MEFTTPNRHNTISPEQTSVKYRRKKKKKCLWSLLSADVLSWTPLLHVRQRKLFYIWMRKHFPANSTNPALIDTRNDRFLNIPPPQRQRLMFFLDWSFTLELCINTHVFSQLKTGWLTNLHRKIWQMGAKGRKPFTQKHENVSQCLQFWSLSLPACFFLDMLVIFVHCWCLLEPPRRFSLSPANREHFLRDDFDSEFCWSAQQTRRGWNHDFKYECRLHRRLQQLTNASGWFHNNNKHTSDENIKAVFFCLFF